MKSNVANLPLSLVRDLATGISQQMFFWGRDVMHSEGNFLLRQGFTRSSSTGLKGTSCYQLPWKGGQIELYGSCAGWYGAEGGFYFNRPRKRCAIWTSSNRRPIPGKWQPEYIDLLAKKNEVYEASLNFMDWLISYETEVYESFGADYRVKNYSEYKKLPKARAWIPPAAGFAWFKCYRNTPDLLERPKYFTKKILVDS